MFLYVEPKITKFYNIVKRHDSWIADIQINFIVRRDCIIGTGRGSLALNRVRMRFARTAQAVQQAPWLSQSDLMKRFLLEKDRSCA